MELQDLCRIQLEFDKKAFPHFWEVESTVDFILRLEYLSNALNGEAGELANIIKKIVRKVLYKKEEVNLKEYLDKIKEEIVDVFIYILIFSNLLNIDLEKEYLKKLEVNKQRFLK